MTEDDAKSQRASRGRPRARTARLILESFRYVWAAARRELLIAVFWEVVGVAGLVGVLLFGREIISALTSEVQPESIGELVPETVGLGVSLLLSGLATVTNREYRTLVTMLTTARTQEDIIDVASTVAYEQHETQAFNDLLQRANSQVTQSAQQMVFDVLSLANVLLTSIALVAVLAGTVPQVLPVLLLVAVPFLLAARASANLAFLTAHELTADDRLRGYLYRSLTGRREAKEVRVFGLAPALRRRWHDLFASRLATMRSVARKRVLLNAVAVVSSAAMVAVLLLVLVRAAISDDISLADAAVAIVALQQLAARIRTASGTTGSLRRSALFLEEFKSFRALRPSPPAADPASSRSANAGLLAVRDLSFTYPNTEREVLSKVSLTIEPGQIVAVVGASGSGKTTLAHLVSRLYDPSEGQISYDGVDVSTLPREEYWRHVAPVFQDFVRFELTAAENVSLGDIDREPDPHAVHDAAANAGINDALERLSNGYDTMLSRAYDGGGDLSVGQWQRVAVARAFYRNAPLLILDEPASALDPVAEHELYGHLSSLMTGRSVLLISHRFSTARLADHILVMHAGRIAEAGTHEDLMVLDGRYAEMFRLQAAGFTDREPGGQAS